MAKKEFKSFEDAVEHISNKIIGTAKPLLVDSMMAISTNKSKNKNTIYIVLTYKKEFIDKDPFYKICFPYVIRISTHNLNHVPFSMREENYGIIVKSVISRREMQIVEFIRKEIKATKHKLYLLNDIEKKKKLADIILTKRDIINKIIGNKKYSYDADFKKINNDIASILKNNKKDESKSTTK